MSKPSSYFHTLSLRAVKLDSDESLQSCLAHDFIGGLKSYELPTGLMDSLFSNFFLGNTRKLFFSQPKN